MSTTIHLLGRPHIEGTSETYRIRSRKSWALLAYLLLNERPQSRLHLAELLFSEAEDPLTALRGSLAEIRRALDGEAEVEGDPVVLRLPRTTAADVSIIEGGSWADAIDLPRLGSALLEGLRVPGASAFESWLLAEQQRAVAATEEILHEAALASLARDSLDEAIGYAVRLVAMTPLEENHHALLIRLYRLAGDNAAAQHQLMTCTELLQRELGVLPGPVVHAALREERTDPDLPTDVASVEAALEAGRAAVSAGAIEIGADSLRDAVRMADRAGDTSLRVGSRLVLAETVIHAVRGLDEEGMAALQAVGDIALAQGDHVAVAEARAELGYVDFLRGRYDRAQVWLEQALEFSGDAPQTSAKALTYLGGAESDRGRYRTALALLDEAAGLARATGNQRRGAYAMAMLGRAHLLRHDLDRAADHLDAALELCEKDHWLSFMPWPQAIRGEVELVRGNVVAARRLLEQSFARACQLGDPCWEGMSARSLALVSATEGAFPEAFEMLADARLRTDRLADPYVWLDAYILDAQCTLGRERGHPDTHRWVAELRLLASRTGMRELTVRSLVHGAALGSPSDAEAALLMAADVDNPVVDKLVAELAGGARRTPYSSA
jgi:DNA-binding SARP family transcriptional activator